ncbi:MAG: 1-acyl-sn-glycerol-3-phosphate acyltransferase [Gemmatimonadetes bacterium]|nr:1-acyl-sn-glycerol-3-phosphate acyltransferase [Gemmatimonadota bacterium]
MRFRLRITAVVAMFVLGVIWGWIVLLLTRSPARARRATSGVMAGPVCRLLLFDVRVEHGERLDGAAPCVWIANHQSIACHQVLANIYRRFDECVVVGKLVGKWNLPLIASLFRATGNITVEPGNTARNAQAFRLARAALARGAAIAVYPEGTRRQDTRHLGRFQDGAFIMAVDSGAPVVPIVVSRFKPKLDPDVLHVEPQVVRVRVLEPIPTDGLARADVPRLRDEARARMQAVLDADAGAS